MSLLFNGDFANPNQPLWLSALNPTTPPTNLTVSTLTVNSTGGNVMTSGGQAYPNTVGAPIAFNRANNAALDATQLRQTPGKNVPTKLNDNYLAVTTVGGAIYDDLALQGLQIYGAQATAPAANTGCAGYLTKGDLPFSVELDTGKFTTPVIYANTINATNGSFSTLNISTGSLVPDPLTVSTLIARQGIISSVNANLVTASTISVQNFALPGSIGFNNVAASTITAGVGNFSTLIAPGGSIAASTVNTGILSTTVAVAKELFTSTMIFNASVSPKLDLGLGGLIGGLVGGFGGNALSVGLGASALGTGIAALTMSRTSGGINPNIYQTVNGTTQLQFSTLGAVTPSVFVNTDSTTPNTTPGNITSNTAYIPAGALAVRSVSDPLNLPNASGAAGQGIQGFSEWQPVYPGYLQLQSYNLTSLLTGNSINLGNSLGDGINIVTAGGGRSTRVNGTFIASTMISNGPVTAPILNALSYVSTPLITNGAPINISPGLTTSTLTVSSFTVGTTVTPAIQTGTLTVTGITNMGGALTTNGPVNLSQGIGGVRVGDQAGTPPNNNTLVVGDRVITPGITVVSAVMPAITSLSSINGVAYNPTGGSPTGAVIMFAAANAPTGWLLCDGSSYSSTNPIYAALYAAISTAYGGTPGATFNVPDLRAKTIFGASAPGFQGDTQPWPNTIGAVSFSELQAEFSGTVVPAGTNPNGRGALAVKSIPLGYELQVGMRVAAASGSPDTGIHIIVQILNYTGGGGTYSNPNYPVLIINPPLSADTNSAAQFTVTPVGAYAYRLANSSINNYYTQATTDVPAHTHGNKQGGAEGNLGVGGIPIGAPTNNSAQITQGVTTNYYYAVGNPTLGQPATVFNIGTSMSVRPSMVVMNYIIKL